MELEHRMARVNGIRMHYVIGGEGPPVVFLHGWPQTWYMWRHVLGPLGERFTVIAPDVRGYGLSDKPRGGYDKRTMAADVRALVQHLGHRDIALVGHDRGARIGHRYGLDHPAEVSHLAVLDIVPTRAVFRDLDHVIARGYWHWLFHMQPDLPELLTSDNVDTYLRYFFERWTYDRHALEEAVPVYVQAFKRPGALRAGFDDYRATFPQDMEDDERSARQGAKLQMPLLVLWGEAGLTGKLPVLEIWRSYAADVRGEPIPDCGHFLAEEAPRPVIAKLLDFLRVEDR